MKKALSIFTLAVFVLPFQNCGGVGFNQTPESSIDKTSEDEPITQHETVGVDDVQPAGAGCVSNMGTSCQISEITTKPGCANPEHLCVDFWAVYYHSPKGCDTSAIAFIEYTFDGTSLWHTGRSNGQTIPQTYVGDSSHRLRCTSIGSAYNNSSRSDSFHNIPNGTCFNSSAAGYPIADTYTKVIVGQGCTHTKIVRRPGTIQCNGSCR